MSNYLVWIVGSGFFKHGYPSNNRATYQRIAGYTYTCEDIQSGLEMAANIAAVRDELEMATNIPWLPADREAALAEIQAATPISLPASCATASPNQPPKPRNDKVMPTPDPSDDETLTDNVPF